MIEIRESLLWGGAMLLLTWGGVFLIFHTCLKWARAAGPSRDEAYRSFGKVS